ncbi:hypothetical protein [Haladaptatus sp. NG-WS-4]
MASRQLLAMLSTFTLVSGALLVGDALHGSVVTGTYGVTSPAFVIRLLPGVVLIWIGYTLRENHERFVSAYFAGRDAARQPSEEEFDERMSPLSGDGLENVEAREREVEENE